MAAPDPMPLGEDQISQVGLSEQERRRVPRILILHDLDLPGDRVQLMAQEARAAKGPEVEQKEPVRTALSPVLRERGGRFTGYLIPGLFGHGVAETPDDAVALATQAARLIPHERARSLCPLEDGPLFRAFLKAGCRTVKMMNVMAMGPYEAPISVWMPSILY